MIAFLRRHVRSVYFVTLVLLLIGAYTAAHMPVAIFPRLTIPRVMIAINGKDAAASTMLVTVTRPLESVLSTVPNLQIIQSQTIRGSVGFTLGFNWGADTQLALQQVNSRISDVRSTLPAGLDIAAEVLNPTVFPILDYSLTSRTHSLAELRSLAEYTLKPRLARLPGVGRVNVNGGQIKEFQILVDPQKLSAYGLSVTQVDDALTNSNILSAAGAYVDQYQKHLVLVNGLLKDPESIKRVVVSSKDRVPITVSDVASVTEAIRRENTIATGDGRPAVLLNIIRQPTGNTVAVADEVRRALKGMSAVLPRDVHLSAFYDQSQLVQEAEYSVLESILVGGVLAMVVLMLFLKSVRSAMTAIVLLPLTLIVTFGALRALGMDLNIMTLGGLAIALGMVIDDSIVVVEHVYHHLEAGKGRVAAIEVGMKEITPAMISSSAASVVTFVPLVFLPGVTGNFFSALALTMIGTLTVSLAVALLVFPAIALWSLPAHARRVSSPKPLPSAAGDGAEPRRFQPPDPSLRDAGDGAKTARHLGSGLADGAPHREESGKAHQPRLTLFGRICKACIRRRWLVLLLTVPVGFGAVAAAGTLRTGFMPEFDEGGFVVDYKMPAGTSLAETDRVLMQVENLLKEEKGVAGWSRLSGGLSGSGLEITPQNQGDINVRLTSGNRPPADEIIADLRTKVKQVAPNMDVDFGQIVGDLIGDLAGSPSPIEVKVFGPDMAVIQTAATDLAARIGKIKGIVDIQDGIVESDPQTEIRVDPVLAAQHGLTVDGVASATKAALVGDEVGSVLLGEIQQPIRVKYPGPSMPEMDPTALSALPLFSPGGQRVPLSTIGSVTTREGEPNLNRENQRLMTSVIARLEGIDLGSAVRSVQAQIKELALPPGVTLELGGLYKSQQQSFRDLSIILALAILFAASVLIITFRSFRATAALLTAAILSLSGGVLALWATQTPLNISSFTGAIMVVGVVVENGVLLFDELQRRQNRGDRQPLEDLLSQSADARLRPILMMQFASILTLLPLSFGIGAGAAMQKPLAIAVIGGVGLSVIFTLIVAPVLYASLTDLKGLVRRFARA